MRNVLQGESYKRQVDHDLLAKDLMQ